MKAKKEKIEYVTAVFAVEGMTCKHCAARVETAMMSVEGVENAVVNLKKKSVTVSMLSEAPLEKLPQAVEAVGYKLVKLD